MYQDHKLRFDWSFVVGAMDVAAVALSFPLAITAARRTHIVDGLDNPRIASCVAYGVLIVWFLYKLRIHNWQAYTRLPSTLGRILVALSGAAVLYVIARFAFGDEITRDLSRWMSVHAVVFVGLIMTERVITRALIENFELIPKARIAFLGWNPRVERVLKTLRAELQNHYQVIGFIHLGTNPSKDPALEKGYQSLGVFSDIEQILDEHRITALLVDESNVGPSRIHRLEAICASRLITLKIIPTAFDVWTSKVTVQTVAGIPVLGIKDIPMNRFHNRFAKRAVDILGALVGLILSAPIIAILAWMIKRESPGPIFFRQVRLGLYDKPFKIIKLRSMKLEAETKSGAVWAVENDPRRLKIGAFMREKNLDELPQFWNVLKGEMSLVGPRPERPEFVEDFKETIRYYNMRHSCKPGVTGWAAINGLRGNTSLEDRLEYDLFYIEHWHLWFDFWIMLKTLKPPKNAY